MRLRLGVASLIVAMSVGHAYAVPDGIYHLIVNGTVLEDAVVVNNVIQDVRLSALPLKTKLTRLNLARCRVGQAGDTLTVELPVGEFAANTISLFSQTLAPAIQVEPLAAPWVNYAVAGQTGVDRLAVALDGVFPFQKRDELQWRASRSLTAQPVSVTATYVQRNPEERVTTAWGYGTSAYNGMTAPVRYVGLGTHTDYALYAPGFITTPSAQMQGSAALPSTVEVFINGQRALSRDIAPGSFTVRDIPSYGTNSDVRVVIRDALGREQVLSAQLAGGPGLLRAGVEDWGFDAGMLQRSDSQYGPAFYSGFYRTGVDDSLTLALSADGTAHERRLFVSGVAGTLYGNVSGSMGLASHGAALFGVGYLAQGSLGPANVSLAAHVQQPYHRFQALGRDVPLAPQRTIVGSLSAYGFSGSLAYAMDGLSGSRTTLSVARGGLFASFTRPSGAEPQFFVGYTFTLGSQSVSATADQSRHSIQWQKSREGYEGLSGSIMASEPVSGMGKSLDASGSYAAPFATGDFGYSRLGNANSTRGVLSGSVVFVEGSPIFTRRIGSSFVLIDTGIPGAKISLAGARAGETDGAGRAIVPEAIPYQPNNLSVQVDALDDRLSGYSYSTRTEAGRGGLLRWPTRVAGVFVEVGGLHGADAVVDGTPGHAIARRGVWVDDQQPGLHTVTIGQACFQFEIPHSAKTGDVLMSKPCRQGNADVIIFQRKELQ